MRPSVARSVALVLRRLKQGLKIAQTPSVAPLVGPRKSRLFQTIAAVVSDDREEMAWSLRSVPVARIVPRGPLGSVIAREVRLNGAPIMGQTDPSFTYPLGVTLLACGRQCSWDSPC
jgi:hypothetical protein